MRLKRSMNMNNNKQVTLRDIQKEIELIRQDLSWLKDRINTGMQELIRIKTAIKVAIDEHGYD